MKVVVFSLLANRELRPPLLQGVKGSKQRFGVRYIYTYAYICIHVCI